MKDCKIILHELKILGSKLLNYTVLMLSVDGFVYLFTSFAGSLILFDILSMQGVSQSNDQVPVKGTQQPPVKERTQFTQLQRASTPLSDATATSGSPRCDTPSGSAMTVLLISYLLMPAFYLAVSKWQTRPSKSPCQQP